MCVPLHFIVPVIPRLRVEDRHLYLLGEHKPGITKDNMKDVCFMHIHGDKLYGISITGQVLWDMLRFPKGLNPSKVSPNLTFLLSAENSECKLSNNFHASPSAGCLNTSSFGWLSACHLI
jgi:hypothetical protein